MRRHDRALKANFNPNQPRVPRGNPDGGQWTSDGGGGQQPKTGDQPEVPEEKPPSSADRTAALKAVARRILQTGEALLNIAKTSAWLQTYSPLVESYNDPPKSLDELQQAVSNPLPGYDIHHIVEQTQAEADGFTRDVIDGPDNLVRIPTLKHQEINAWYQTKNEDFGGLSPREYLSGRNWEVRRAVGLEALGKFGVLKP